MCSNHYYIYKKKKGKTLTHTEKKITSAENTIDNNITTSTINILFYILNVYANPIIIIIYQYHNYFYNNPYIIQI